MIMWADTPTYMLCSPALFKGRSVMITEGFQIFACSPSDDVAVEKAKDYIKLHGLSSDDVKIMQGNHTVAVVAKRPLELKLPEQQETTE